MLDFHIIIPARFASTRLPEKMLRLIANKPLIEHTHAAASKAGAASVTIATDHESIADILKKSGAAVLMTDKDHLTGTDRIAEAVDLLGLADDAIIVNLQGDEPLMPAILLQQVAANLAKHPDAAIATLAEPISDARDLFEPSIVKVVRDAKDFALYFSRAPIPWDRDHFSSMPNALHGQYFRHIGIYAYRASFLRAYQKLASAPCEALEKLEQLRALYHGYKIHVDVAKAYCPPGVDTLEDLEKIRGLMSVAQ